MARGSKEWDLSTKFECLLMLNEIGGSTDQDELFGEGYYTQIMTETVARGHTYAKDLPNVANMGIVRSIKLAN